MWRTCDTVERRVDVAAHRAAERAAAHHAVARRADAVARHVVARRAGAWRGVATGGATGDGGVRRRPALLPPVHPRAVRPAAVAPRLPAYPSHAAQRHRQVGTQISMVDRTL